MSKKTTPKKKSRRLATAVVASLTATTLLGAAADARSIEADRKAVADLDTRYQAAVEKNDAETMAKILDENFILVVGSGKVVNRTELLDSAKNKDVIYEQQVEDAGTQTVRLWGDTAIVTARLWIKGTRAGQPLERRLWFSDTYVRTKSGWRYAFGQASLPLPN